MVPTSGYKLRESKIKMFCLGLRCFISYILDLTAYKFFLAAYLRLVLKDLLLLLQPHWTQNKCVQTLILHLAVISVLPLEDRRFQRYRNYSFHVSVCVFNQSHHIGQVRWKILKVFRAGNVELFSQLCHIGWVQPLIALGRCSQLTFLPWKNGGLILMKWIHVAFSLQAAL